MINNTKLKKDSKQNNKQKKSNFLFVLIPIILIGIILLISYSLRTSVIRGKIISYGDNKALLKDVKVIIDDKDEFINNSDSSYKIGGLSSGEHNIKFKKDGYNILNQTISLEKGQDLVFDAYLKEIIKNNIPLNEISFSNFVALSLDNKLVNNLMSYDTHSFSDNFVIINSKIYTYDGQGNIIITDLMTGNKISKIDLPIGSRVEKLVVSNLKDKIYMVLSNNNSIGVIDINTNKFLEETPSLSSKIKYFLINYDNNRSIIITDDQIHSFNILNHLITKLDISYVSINDLVFYKNILFIVDKSNQTLVKIDFYNLDKESIKFDLNFSPEKIVITKLGKLYISSSNNINLINTETGNNEKTINLGTNIISMRFSYKDDYVYITDNSKNIHVFDSNKDILFKEKIMLNQQVKDLVIYE